VFGLSHKGAGMSLSRMRSSREKGWLTDMFRANPEAYEAGCGPMENPAAAQYAEQEGSPERSRPAQIPIEEAVNGRLKGLRNTGRQVAAALNAGQQLFADGQIPCMRRPQYRGEDARSRNRILNREINADAADRGHGMGGVADAE
jgi:hypothetical protein